MPSRPFRIAAVVTVFAAALPLSVFGAAAMSSRGGSRSEGASPSLSAAEAAYAKLPMSFVPNQGQLPEGIGFGAQGAGYSLGLNPTQAVFALSSSEDAGSTPASPAVGPERPGPAGEIGPAVVQMQLVGANAAARPQAGGLLPGKANYLTGDSSRWRTGVPTYGRVTYEGVYQGVDVSYYGNQGQFEYDFIVAPGADPSVVALAFAGTEAPRLDDGGELVLTADGRELRHRAPVIYQDGSAGREPVSGGFVIRENGHVAFAVGPYDHSRPLVIDPTVVYSTFFGGTGFDFGLSVAVDYLGHAYISGSTDSPDFPVTPGAYDTSYNGNQDGFVAKLSRDGSALLYSTFLGGSGRDDADSIAVDFTGNAYVRGITVTPDFPTTPGAFDRTFNGGFDAYVTKLSADGSSLVYSSFLGGTNFDSGSGIAVDRRGAAYVGGITGSPEFPTTPGAFQTTFHGVGGPLPPLVGPPGDYDGYMTKFAPDGSSLEYSTLLGGSDHDGALGFDVDRLGNAYVGGLTFSPDFPTTPGAADQTYNGGGEDVVVTKINPQGSALVYSTFLGGTGFDIAAGLAVNLLGQAYVAGETQSPDFPTTPDAVATGPRGDSDAFVTMLNRDGTAFVYSTYLGGSQYDAAADVAADLRGAAYVTGGTSSPNFPTTAGAFDPTFNGGDDAFVTKLSPPPPLG